MMTGLLATLISGIQDGGLEVVDLTQPLNHDTPIISLPEQWAQTPPFRMRELSRYDEPGPFWYWNAFETGEHTGTHLDAPCHWATGRELETVDAIAPKSLIGPAVVVDLAEECEQNPDTLLSPAHLEDWEQRNGTIPSGAWILVRTGWDARFNDAEAYANVGEDGMPHTPGISKEAAEFLTTERDILGVGVETVGTDAGLAATFDPPFPNHNIMHGAGRMGLTSLANLDQLPEAGSVVMALPLKIEDGSGSPARVIALVTG
jgi:kynurenine formamidase